MREPVTTIEVSVLAATAAGLVSAGTQFGSTAVPGAVLPGSGQVVVDVCAKLGVADAKKMNAPV
jgi:hypothetical protein